jgi:exo-beta-1,3-glucanase (GH17 family)
MGDMGVHELEGMVGGREYVVLGETGWMLRGRRRRNGKNGKI